MVYLSSEAYGEKGYKLGNHLFYTPDLNTDKDNWFDMPYPFCPIPTDPAVT
jgi:hypothetical protein